MVERGEGYFKLMRVKELEELKSIIVKSNFYLIILDNKRVVELQNQINHLYRKYNQACYKLDYYYSGF